MAHFLSIPSLIHQLMEHLFKSSMPLIGGIMLCLQCGLKILDPLSMGRLSLNLGFLLKSWMPLNESTNDVNLVTVYACWVKK